MFPCILLSMFALVNALKEEEVLMVTLENARADILKNYPKHVLFGRDPFVSLKFTPLSVSEVIEARQTFSLTVLLTLEWTDPWLQLNTSSLNISVPDSATITYSSSEILLPVFAIINSAFGQVFVTFEEERAFYDTRTGNLWLHKVLAINTQCDIDMTYFPFDEQTCEVMLDNVVGSFNLSVSVFLINGTLKRGQREWEIIHVKDGKHNWSKKITFHLKRNSSFYLWSVLFPMVLLSTLNSFVFLLPSESGEKISFLVALFVTFAVFLNFVNDIVPKSDRLPRLALYLVLVQCHSTLCILATLFILNRHHKRNDTSPSPVTEECLRQRLHSTEEEISCRKQAWMKFSVYICSEIQLKTYERLLFTICFVLACLMPIVFVV